MLFRAQSRGSAKLENAGEMEFFHQLLFPEHRAILRCKCDKLALGIGRQIPRPTVSSGRKDHEPGSEPGCCIGPGRPDGLPLSDFSLNARDALRWTQQKLESSHREWLRSLRRSAIDGNVHMVHACPPYDNHTYLNTGDCTRHQVRTLFHIGV